MKIVIAKTAGFCMGVRRAVEMVLDAPRRYQEPISTFGPLIHNPQVLNLLRDKGIDILDDIPKNGRGTVLIRAHGVPPETREALSRAGFTVIDATCPRVIKVQSIIRKHAAKGYASIIIGDKDHPEVIGLLGYAGDTGYVVDSLAGLDALPDFDKAIIVAQTTQNTSFFRAVKAWAEKNHPTYKVFDTICDSTSKRQAEVTQLATAVDAIVVVGGRASGNTMRLVEIAHQAGKPAFHVETEADLDFQALSTAQSIGITAGASTPNWIIKQVHQALERNLMTQRRGWRSLWFSLQRVLLLTNFYVALGAGCLCFAAAALQEIPRYTPYVLIATLYVLSMHILNYLTAKKSDKYNDPDRAAFYQKHKRLLTIIAFITGGTGLITAALLGKVPFIVLLTMSLMGLSYNMIIIPEQLASRFQYRRIRDIPGSKTFLIAMAWGLVTAILPSLSTTIHPDFPMIAAFIWTAGMVFARTAFFDSLDIQGNRIIGQETLPIILGEKRTLALVKTILLGIGILLVLAGLSGMIPSLGFVLAVCPLALFGVLTLHERGYSLPLLRLEFTVESHFLLAGLLAGLWTALCGPVS